MQVHTYNNACTRVKLSCRIACFQREAHFGIGAEGNFFFDARIVSAELSPLLPDHHNSS